MAVLRVRGAPHEVGPAPWWQTGAGALRDGLRAAAAVLPEGPAGLLPGLAVGDVRDLPDEVRDDFRAAGLSHLTAVSGDNPSRAMSRMAVVSAPAIARRVVIYARVSKLSRADRRGDTKSSPSSSTS